MFLEGILAISGESGLFKLISKGNNKLIVESLITEKKMATSATARISSLEDVAIYTNDEEVQLKEVLVKMFNQFDGQTVLTSKPSNIELMNMLDSVLPEYDKERVYVSDIKKIVNWYNLLITKGILTKDSVKPKAEETEATKPAEETVAENKTEE